MRAFVCKDCQREVEHLVAEIYELERSGGTKSQLKKLRADLEKRREKATYNENWAKGLVDRGGSRSDRCKDHRLKHRTNIQGIAVAYIDLQTVGEVADRENPVGPLGGLGPLPVAHEVVPNTSYDLQEVKVGMTDEHVTTMIALLREKRVLVLKAGTGTGKSTFAPYRLMDPPPASLENLPPDAPFAKLSDLGPIIVTEPRIQAAVGVATFVGGTMSGSGGVGPGYPVGYQVSGDRNHDEACELIYVTDGTMINWLREGRLSRIGTVIVDEAHERSTNIDFIMGYLKQELTRYPHLRVIITSATFNTAFYKEYFGGPDVAHVMEVPAEKTFGYGMPLFPNLDAAEDGEEDILERWTDESLPLSSQQPRDKDQFILRHWPDRDAPAFEKDDVADMADVGMREDVWDTTARLLDLRYTGQIPMEQWRERMPDEMAKFIIRLAKGLDERGLFGDILGFLPTRRTIDPVCAEVERALGKAYQGNVFPLISTLPKAVQREALAKRRKGDPRKIVISTNLAETSLTVEGVRFIVDSGVIAQSEWDPELARGGIPTKPHSQAGIKQRWGRVGRKSPGWVFPLYSKGQYLELAEDTPPGSTRENLEALVMTAKMGGIDVVVGFPWPAAFEPTTTKLDETAREARDVFLRELRRADFALRAGGAVDADGHPTSFGKELVRFQGLGSTASALAVMYADRLACVPEVVTILALLEDVRLIGQRGLLQDDYEWPDEWRLEASDRHRGLATLCEDDAELVLVTAAAWERADPAKAPWDQSDLRKSWARQWWVNHEVLLEAAEKRHEVIAALSPAMKEDVKRFLEPALINRARGVLTRSLAAHLYVRVDAQTYRHVPSTSAIEEPQAEADGGAEGTDGVPRASSTAVATVFTVEDDTVITPASQRVIALRRRESREDSRISNLVIAQSWAVPDSDDALPTGVVDAMRMVVAAAKFARAEPERSRALHLLASWPVGQRMKLVLEGEGTRHVTSVADTLPPFPRPLSEAERGATVGRRDRRARRRMTRSVDDDDLQGTRADSDGEIVLRARPAGYVDEDRLEESAFQDSDRAASAPVPCGECFPCLDGREEDCENPGETQAIDSTQQDPVQSWLKAAREGEDVSRPDVVTDATPAGSDGWYEVVGYARMSSRTAVRVRPDWRAGRPGNPAQHVDVKAGDPIEVAIGPLLRHHGGVLRSFERTDGRGRFVVAEASNRRSDVQERRKQIAVSLDRGNATLLTELAEGGTLIATVVPARADGCFTITLLELLYQHWAKAQVGRGVEYHLLEQTRRNAARKPVYAAVVDQAANEYGYVTASLLHQDGALGVRHRFSFNLRPRTARSGDATQGGQATDVPDIPPLSLGDPLLLNIVSDQSRLDVGGLDLDVLEEIVRSSHRQLELTGVNTEKLAGDTQWDRNPKPKAEALSANARGEEGEGGERPAPPGAALRPTSDKPLSRSAAEQLCGLSDDPKWPNEVWSFWARSHHLTVHSQRPYLVGTNREPFDVAAVVVVETGSPLEQQRVRIQQYGRDHPVNSVVECTVVRLTDRGVYVELAPDIDGLIPLRELSWASRTSHPSEIVSPGSRLRALLRSLPEPPNKIELSVRAVTPDPFVTFAHAHPVGDTVPGSVRNITDTHAYVRLTADVDGVIHISQLAPWRIEHVSDVLKVGDELDTRVLGFDEGRRQVELSRKGVLPELYVKFKAAHSIGQAVPGVIRSSNKSFVYVNLADGAQGVIHISHLASQRVDQPTDIVSIGQPVQATIIGYNDERDQVLLSLRMPPNATAPGPFVSR
jgi:HrpA-like RNA helicase/predicted RNA-binding protein with RPS1 domain